MGKARTEPASLNSQGCNYAILEDAGPRLIVYHDIYQLTAYSGSGGKIFRIAKCDLG